MPFSASRGIAGSADLEYWVGNEMRRTRLIFDRDVLGFRLKGPSRYGSLMGVSR